jgi:hexosaminidase
MINIIPKPVSCTELPGVFTLTPATVIVTDSGTHSIGLQLSQMLAPATGWWLAQRTAAPTGASAIVIRLDQRLAKLGSEGYRLLVTPQRVTVRAFQPAGLFHALHSLLQLLPADIFRQAPASGVSWTLPCIQIEDYPRFAWRGAMLDVCRHFMPKEFVKKFIDLLALHKMNSFHWHLTDDQGWRIEIKKYPRLTEVGAWRKETQAGKPDENWQPQGFDGIPHGGFYTQEDVREIVAYANQRFINVVPEIEMPGHSQAAVAAYPELGNTGSPVEVSTHWGIHQDIYNPDESTILFLQDVLGEVLDLFPSPFIHTGGDEAPKEQWMESPAAQARMRVLGLANEDELQSYFIRRMDSFLTARGRRLIGWDEILEGGLAQNATVMSWRGEAGGIQTAVAGHDVVMAPNHYTYLDYYQSEDTDHEPIAIGGYLPLEMVYGYEPIPAELDTRAAGHVLGTQCQLWTEFIPNPKQVEYMAFPRLAALAEVAWTPAEIKDYPNFLARLSPHLLRLDALDVNYRPTDNK